MGQLLGWEQLEMGTEGKTREEKRVREKADWGRAKPYPSYGGATQSGVDGNARREQPAPSRVAPERVVVNSR